MPTARRLIRLILMISAMLLLTTATLAFGIERPVPPTSSQSDRRLHPYDQPGNQLTSQPANQRILMFVAYNDVWWAEYKVVYEALRAQGYEIDVRSSAAGEALSYGSSVDATPSGTGLDPTYPAPASYAEFQALFEANFEVAWEAAWNAPQSIPLNGRIQDVTSLNAYDAIVIPGGRGAVAYRYDGTYADLSPQDMPGFHVTTAAEVQAAAEQLNLLIGQALEAGKPVSAECHAAPLAAFARVPGTAGQGFDGLGRSILEGGYATGYPFNNGDTAASYANLGLTMLDREKLVLDGPEAPDFSGHGQDRVATTADWYPESAAYLARTLLNILETYPTPIQQVQPAQVLVFGGDEPINYPPQQPARYTDLVDLLNGAGDNLAITAVGTNNPADMNLANLQNYDVLLYFRHNQIPQAAQEAIRAYVDGGGGLVAIHHAIYNHQNAKGTLIDLIGGELPHGVSLNNENGLVYFGESNHLINVNLGHFVSTYGVHALITQTVEYTSLLGLPNANVDNDDNRGYYSFRIEAPDELYLASQFNPGVTFGRGVNDINRLFANDRFVAGSPNPNNGHYDTWGWTRDYDGDSDGQSGRIVYLQPGETNDRTLSQPAYRQVIKNAVIWSANQGQVPTGNPNSPLGTNLGLVTDWSTQLPFVDAFKMARTWIPHSDNDWDTGEADLIEVDENGWVTALPAPEDGPIFTYVGTLLLLGDAGGLNNLAGQYIVLYEGEGTIEYGGGASKDEAASIHGRDVVNVSATGFVHLMITETDPNQTGDYIRNIRFIMPGFAETYETQLFNPVFLNKLANFSVLRFMPWMRTNDEPAGEWAERPQVDDYTYTTNNGVPLEIMLDLANRTQTSPWFNMPHTATDEYMTEFAAIVRDNLSVTSQAIVEYSNETWNGQFPQADWVREQGLAEFNIDNPTPFQAFQAGLNWHGKRAAEMCEIWKTVWGEESERVICIAASQAANSWTAEQVLSCPLWTEGAPCVDHGIDALAIAPYFAGYVGHYNLEEQVEDWTAAPDGGLDLLFTEIITGGVLMGTGVPPGGSLQQAYQRMSDNITVAETHGVEPITYEGGQHFLEILDPNDNEDTYNEAITNLFTNANRDSRMGQIYSQYFAEWRNRGGCLFANFTLVQQDYNQFGSWGILEYINQDSSPKYEAVMNFIDDNPWSWENCTLPTAEVIFLPFILN